MKNQNFAFIFLFFIALQSAWAQSITVSTANPGLWTAANVNVLNTTPGSLAGINFNLQPIAYASFCSNQTTTPAPQMTIPASNCQPGAGRTIYYRTTFNINNLSNYCTGSVQIRADDAFRVYINGVQVGPANLTLSGCNGNTVINQLDGNNFNTIYTLNNLQSFLISGQNTIIVEVPNCITVSYLSAVFSFPSLPDAAVPNQNPIHFSVVQNANGYTTSLWGIDRGSMRLRGFGSNWMGNWTIESSANSNGPWTPFAVNQENSSTQLTPWVPAQFSYAMWYRITYTITTSCGATATYFLTINIACSGCLIAPGGGENIFSSSQSDNQITDIPDQGRDEITSRSQFSNPPLASDSLEINNTVAIDLIQSAFVDNNSHSLVISLEEETSNSNTYVEIYSMIGKLMWTEQTQSKTLRIDVSDWPNGIYVIHSGRDKKAKQTKKVAILSQ